MLKHPPQLPTIVLLRTNLTWGIRLPVQMKSYITFSPYFKFFSFIFRVPDHQHCPGCIPSSWGLILSSCDVFLFWYSSVFLCTVHSWLVRTLWCLSTDIFEIVYGNQNETATSSFIFSFTWTCKPERPFF